MTPLADTTASCVTLHACVTPAWTKHLTAVRNLYAMDLSGKCANEDLQVVGEAE